jgi:hypothetical protein
MNEGVSAQGRPDHGEQLFLPRPYSVLPINRVVPIKMTIPLMSKTNTFRDNQRTTDRLEEN